MFPHKKWPFTRQTVQHAPEDGGVIVLWDADEAIYIGRAAAIREDLIAHQDGVRGDCSMRATHYSWEITIWAGAREAELLAEFAQRHRRAPRCQQRAA